MATPPPCVALACMADSRDCPNGPFQHEYAADDHPCCIQPWQAQASSTCRRCYRPITLWRTEAGRLVWRGEDWYTTCRPGTIRHEPMS